MPRPENEALLCAVHRAWREYKPYTQPTRVVVVVRFDPEHFCVRLVDISSNHPFYMPVVSEVLAMHFADDVTAAIGELVQAREAHEQDSFVFMHQRAEDSPNTYRWVLIDPATIDPVLCEGGQLVEEYCAIG